MGIASHHAHRVERIFLFPRAVFAVVLSHAASTAAAAHMLLLLLTATDNVAWMARARMWHALESVAARLLPLGAPHLTLHHTLHTTPHGMTQSERARAPQ